MQVPEKVAGSPFYSRRNDATDLSGAVGDSAGGGVVFLDHRDGQSESFRGARQKNIFQPVRVVGTRLSANEMKLTVLPSPLTEGATLLPSAAGGAVPVACWREG